MHFLKAECGDGVRYLKKDHVVHKEYRYGCSIDCGGTPMRVYERTLGSQGGWTSMEDYLQAGNALGYGMNWQATFSNGSLLMMGSQASPSQFVAQDAASTVVVQDSPPSCLCLVPAQSVCSPFASDCGSACSYNDQGYIVNMHGQGGLPAFGISFNQYQPNLVIAPILVKALEGCVMGVSGELIATIGRWLICAFTQLLTGKNVSDCGDFPVLSLCNLIASCIAGALTGGIMGKFFPKIHERIQELGAAAAGALSGGVCDSLRTVSPPCSPPKQAPVPRPPSSGVGGSGRLTSPIYAF